jgi:molybdopterin-guanine dinucleotide biosynthesis protein A
LAGLDWTAAKDPGAEWMVSLATDTPFLPGDLVGRLVAAVESTGAEVACATSGGRLHPVIALWPVKARAALRRALVEDGLRRADRWLARFRVATVDYPCAPLDPLFNINRPEDLAEAEGMLAVLAARS